MFSNINLVDENLNKDPSYAFYLITFSLWSDQFPHNQKDDGVEYGHFIQIFAKILNLELLRQFLTGFYHPCRKYFSCFPQDREIRTIKYIYICDRIFHSSKKKNFFHSSSSQYLWFIYVHDPCCEHFINILPNFDQCITFICTKTKYTYYYSDVIWIGVKLALKGWKQVWCQARVTKRLCMCYKSTWFSPLECSRECIKDLK